MKTINQILLSVLMVVTMTSFAFAEEQKASVDMNKIMQNPPNSNTQMKEDTDGEIDSDEFRVISVNGGLTRRPCPYTCEMRGIPREFCHEFRSIDGSECYIEDTRLPNDALPK